jgi:hypothetical protein
MFLVIGLLAALTIFIAAFYSLLNRTLSREYDGSNHNICLNLAEAGVDKAVAELRAGKTDYAGEDSTPLGEGFFTVEATPIPGGEQWKIVSTGSLRDGKFMHKQVRISAEVQIGRNGAQILRWAEVHP